MWVKFVHLWKWSVHCFLAYFTMQLSVGTALSIFPSLFYSIFLFWFTGTIGKPLWVWTCWFSAKHYRAKIAFTWGSLGLIAFELDTRTTVWVLLIRSLINLTWWATQKLSANLVFIFVINLTSLLSNSEIICKFGFYFQAHGLHRFVLFSSLREHL